MVSSLKPGPWSVAYCQDERHAGFTLSWKPLDYETKVYEREGWLIAENFDANGAMNAIEVARSAFAEAGFDMNHEETPIKIKTGAQNVTKRA